MASKPKKERVGGRAKGTPNKASAQVKENILAVFNRLEGTAGMAKWAKENPTEFYRIYARMLPKEVEASVEHKHTPTRDEIVAAGAALGLSEEMLFDDAGPSTKAH